MYRYLYLYLYYINELCSIALNHICMCCVYGLHSIELEQAHAQCVSASQMSQVQKELAQTKAAADG